MNTPTINTVMTFVVRMKEPIELFFPDDTYRVIRWVNEFAEPQVFYPAQDDHTPIECGIVGCVTYLRDVPLGTTYRVERIEDRVQDIEEAPPKTKKPAMKPLRRP